MKKIILFLIGLLLAGLSLQAQKTWTDENGIMWRFTTSSSYDSSTDSYTHTASLYGSSRTEYGVTTYTPCVSGPIPDTLIIPSAFIVDDVEYAVTVIGFGAFQECKDIKEVVVPEGVTYMNTWAFSRSSLTKIHLPESLTYINSYAFNNCSSLTCINIPESVMYIGDDAFYGCNSLNDVYITDIAAWCALKVGGSYSNPMTYAKKLYLNGEVLTDLVIPDGVTAISNNAFSNNADLVNVHIPESVTSIGSGAFRGCINLANVTGMEGVTEIGGEVFHNCTSLTEIKDLGKITSMPSYLFAGCTQLTSISIPASVTSIGSGAFYDCI